MLRALLLSALALAAVILGGCPDDLEVCLPECEGRECGPDGCGGTCGPACGSGLVCDNPTGQCITCPPDCAGKDCGDDGCGGSCGDCGAGYTCDLDGQCQACQPQCPGKDCGDDGCGGSCGDCADGYACDEQGQCQPCERDCTGKRCCDDDGCGGTCEDLICPERGCKMEACECCACTIDGSCYVQDETPFGDCRICNPGSSGGDTDWSAVSGHCLIGEDCFADSAPNPDNSCEECSASWRSREWTALSDGAACDEDEGSCLDGICIHTGEIWVDCEQAPGVCPGAVGSQAKPFCSIGRALSAAGEGATIRVASGLCEEQVSIEVADVQVIGAPGSTRITSDSSPVLAVVGVGGVGIQGVTVEMAGEMGIHLNVASNSTLDGVVVRQVEPTNDADRKGIAITGGSSNLADVEVGPIESTALGAEVTGIKLESTGGIILDSCRVHNLAAGRSGRVTGIRAAATDLGEIVGCEVWSLSATDQYQVKGISLVSSMNWHIEHTRVRDLAPGVCPAGNACQVIGIELDEAAGFTSHRNEIAFLGPSGVENLAGYWLKSQTAITASLANDLIHDLASAAEEPCNSCGIRIDSQVTATIVNPTITRIGVGDQSVTNSGVYAPSAPQLNVITNAILADIKGYGLRAASANTLACRYAGFFDCSSDNWYGTSCGDTVLADPQFVDPAGDDFRLQGTSPYIDAGDPTSNCELEPACPINLGAYGNTEDAAAAQ